MKGSDISRGGTSSYYQRLFPCLTQKPRIFAENKNFVFSDIVLPHELREGRSIPSTSSHILGVLFDTTYKGVKYKQDGERWRSIDMKPGQFRLASAHQNAVEWQWKKENVWGKNNQLIIHFSPQRMAKIALEVFDVDEFRIELPHQIAGDDPLIKNLFLSLRQELMTESEHCRLYQDSVMQMLCTHILSRYCLIKKAIPEYPGGLSSVRLKRVVDYMKTHYRQDLTLEDLSVLCDMGSVQFTSQFKTSIGVSPQTYLINVRLQKAMQILKHSNTAIDSVAKAVGYSNPFHFNRLFKLHVGETPGTFRQMSR